MTDSRSFRPAKPASVAANPPAGTPADRDFDADDTTCPRCGESDDLAKVKGCVKCLKCGFKFDCNGW
jgi:ribosomal protein S27AE